jgi:hypothetical protein
VTISNTLPSTKSRELHCWNLIKVLSPLHITWVLWLDWEMHVTWYQNHEVLSLNLGYTLIPLRIIFTYKSPYGGARVAQTSRLQSGVAGLWLARSKGILEFDKRFSHPFSYHLDFMVKLIEENDINFTAPSPLDVSSPSLCSVQLHSWAPFHFFLSLPFPPRASPTFNSTIVIGLLRVMNSNSSEIGKNL